jgi:hypothetical protein
MFRSCSPAFPSRPRPLSDFFLKLFSGLAATAFGILGIGTKTRHDSGKLTKEGKVALADILIAGAIGSIATINDGGQGCAFTRPCARSSSQSRLGGHAS